MVSEDQVDPTPLVELLRQVGWWDQTIKILGKAGMMDKYNLTIDRCRIFNSLVNICHADNIFPKEHMDPSLFWVSKFINKAWDSLNETESQTTSSESYERVKRSIVAPQSQNQTTALILAKPRSKRQVSAVANSLLGAAKSGVVKKFLFNLVGPVLDELKTAGQREAAKAVAKHIIPYTGLKDHGTGHIVKQLLHQGNVSQAISTLKDNTADFNPNNMWVNEPLPSPDSIIPHDQMNNYQVYMAARKTLPYIDTMLTDRLKSQSIVDSSLTTALFSGLKKGLNKDLTAAGNKLQEVLANTIDSLEEQQVDRITIYSACGVILIVSLSGILIVVRCLCKVHSTVDKIDKTMALSEDIQVTTSTRQPSRSDYCNPSQQVYLEMDCIERNGTLTY